MVVISRPVTNSKYRNQLLLFVFHSVVELSKTEQLAIYKSCEIFLKKNENSRNKLIYNAMSEQTVCANVSRRRTTAAMTEINAHGVLK